MSGWPIVFHCQMEGLRVHGAQRKDLTLEFLQTTVARMCYCRLLFVVAYSYSKRKVLYESCLISSHIFIPDPPTYLTPPLPVVGKTSPGQDVEDSGNYLEDGPGRGGKRFKSNLNTFLSRGNVQSPNLFGPCQCRALLETLDEVSNEISSSGAQRKPKCFERKSVKKDG